MLYIHPTTLSTLHHHVISYKKKQRNLITSAILYCYTGEIPGWKIPATWSLALQKQTRTIHMRKIWQQTKCTPVASKALNHTVSSSEMKTTFWAFLMSFRAVTISFLPGNTATLQKKSGDSPYLIDLLMSTNQKNKQGTKTILVGGFTNPFEKY